MDFRCLFHSPALALERYLFRSEFPFLFAVLLQDILIAPHDEAVRLVGLCSGLEEIGRVVFQSVHPRFQVGDMVLIEVPLEVRALDAEVGGEEEAAEFSHKLLLSVFRAAEIGVAAAIEGGRMAG